MYPSDPLPTGLLLVPVRTGPAGSVARLCRTPLGVRTAVGFTSGRRLVAALGPAQAWIILSEPALRALTAPLGAAGVMVDPRWSAPSAPAVPERPVPRPPVAVP
ncbi:SAV_915 family protein [Streptomyces specialis]|uniref:SAV_915 family protein n=1 Tax=Streptomyces specialis TaxID=498367 RepID=UPI00073E13E8|nr:SAV_915 family protein [Streptomyces specialis]